MNKAKEKKPSDKYFDFTNPQNLPSNPADILESIKLNLKCKTSGQKKLVRLIKECEVVICAGPPGTGKTFVACSEALSLLKSHHSYKKIVIVKSVTPLKNEEIGYLKGTLKEKMEPFVYSFINNFEKIIGKYNTDKLRESGVIEEMPIAYLRGVNIDDAVVIVDEAQNISIDNIHTIMTRLGQNAKMIFLGDENQIDMKHKEDSALAFLLDNFAELDEIGTIRLSDEDIVRNPLIKKIEEIFKKTRK